MSKYHGCGATLEHSIDGGTTYTVIAGVGDISGPDMSRDTVDTTTHDSTNKWREFVPGLKDGGEVSIVLVYDPEEGGNQGLLRADFEGGLARDFKLTWPTTNSAHLLFQAFVTGLGDAFPLEGRIEQQVTLKITGTVTHNDS